jgi:2-oxoisovalerate dehydrogenase E1 component
MRIEDLFREAIVIRKVEEKIVSLFKKGEVSGTVHTCIGQEFSALAFSKQLEQKDSIFSNHRCHGHYMAFTGDYCGLLAEVMGKRSGVCGGVGGSQHLCKDTFYSNGIQGGIVAVAAGMALAHKLREDDHIGLVYIGDGTLGEGIVYETFNIIAKWEIPLLIVCENNFYAQSTHQSSTLAGTILDRPQAFGIKTFEDSTEDYHTLIANAKKSISYVRNNRKPAFHLVHTYRLSAHSTGDDLRDKAEIARYYEVDPVTIFSKQNPERYDELVAEAVRDIDDCVNAVSRAEVQTIEEYIGIAKEHLSPHEIAWSEVAVEGDGDRYIHKINAAFRYLMDTYNDIVFIGEDIHSPYGGAFKATRDLSAHHPHRVFSTPISEAAITGIANGLAINGYRPFLEIMFGDFMTLAMDQIINHASKFYHMYNKQKNCPIVIRTAMGGKRGFGPTHSQTLDKFLLGIDNVKVIALNTLVDPLNVYETIYKNEEHPVVVIENKVDYSRKYSDLDHGIVNNLLCERCNSRYPILRLSPKDLTADVSIITYGGMVHDVIGAGEALFVRKEIATEIIVLSQISPLPIEELLDAIRSEFIVVVEEGSQFAGFGSEVVASLAERSAKIKKVMRISSLPVPIPSSKVLEQKVLCNEDLIVSKVSEVFFGD